MSDLTDRLDEWAALAEKATPGPWWQSAPGLVYGKDRFEEGYAEAVAQATPGNGDFIAASRTLVPTLVEALRAVLERVGEPLDKPPWNPPVDSYDVDISNLDDLAAEAFYVGVVWGAWSVKADAQEAIASALGVSEP